MKYWYTFKIDVTDIDSFALRLLLLSSQFKLEFTEQLFNSFRSALEHGFGIKLIEIERIPVQQPEVIK